MLLRPTPSEIRSKVAVIALSPYSLANMLEIVADCGQVPYCGCTGCVYNIPTYGDNGELVHTPAVLVDIPPPIMIRVYGHAEGYAATVPYSDAIIYYNMSITHTRAGMTSQEYEEFLNRQMVSIRDDFKEMANSPVTITFSENGDPVLSTCLALSPCLVCGGTGKHEGGAPSGFCAACCGRRYHPAISNVCDRIAEFMEGRRGR